MKVLLSTPRLLLIEVRSARGAIAGAATLLSLGLTWLFVTHRAWAILGLRFDGLALFALLGGLLPLGWGLVQAMLAHAETCRIDGASGTCSIERRGALGRSTESHALGNFLDVQIAEESLVPGESASVALFLVGQSAGRRRLGETMDLYAAERLAGQIRNVLRGHSSPSPIATPSP